MKSDKNIVKLDLLELGSVQTWPPLGARCFCLWHWTQIRYHISKNWKTMRDIIKTGKSEWKTL